MNLKDTELRLGLPGTNEEAAKRFSVGSKKRCLAEETSSEEEEDYSMNKSCIIDDTSSDHDNEPPAKVQVVGWPPVRNFRKNMVKNGSSSGVQKYVKVSMAGAPYLRKIDLKVYSTYPQLLKALENMFKCTFGEYSEREGYNGSEYVPTYEDKDGDWMLVGDVPWEMFMCSCNRLRIMKASEAKGFGCL
ncbi:auxin-induced protein 22D [Senna tora]|uniref:Auxin-induced protein n=1 Tax=Senna tora TaxID=362788 RepID=A0A834SW77_9FABA|nr:auxin-induced protein 22D [Senna tora]